MVLLSGLGLWDCLIVKVLKEVMGSSLRFRQSINDASIPNLLGLPLYQCFMLYLGPFHSMNLDFSRAQWKCMIYIGEIN